MKLIYDGKTKTLYDIGDGYCQLYFKDDMTGENGVFDPGANTVGLTVEGAGKAGLAMSAYYFRLIADKGCPTHFVDADLENRTMTVKPAKVFGDGLEVIVRYKAMGSFIKRYGGYVSEGTPLGAVLETTLKDDQRNDPLINEDALLALGVLKAGEYQELSAVAKRICLIIKEDLAAKGLDLRDIKLEFGRGGDGGILLIDELSGGNMRVYEGDKALSPFELTKKVLATG